MITRKIIITTISIILLSTIIAVPPKAMATVQNYQVKEVIQAAVYYFNQTEMTAQTEKAALVEMYTATWCSACAKAEPALDKLSVEYGSKLAILEYHPYPDLQGDIFGIKKGNDRMSNYYGSGVFPTAIFDGAIKKIGMEDPNEDLHSTYKNYIELRLSKLSPIDINLSGSVNETLGHVNVTYKTSGYFSRSLTARINIFEDDIYYDYPGSNGITNHRFVVRDVLDEEVISINASISANIRKDFSVGADWNTSKIGVVAFAQSDEGARYAESIGDLSQLSAANWWWISILAILAAAALILLIYLKRKKKMISSEEKND